jgi:multidrug efflux system membrane fusion protein
MHHTMALLGILGASVGVVAISAIALEFLPLPAFALDRPPVGVPVEVANPKRENVPVYLNSLGFVQSENTVNITPQISGQLESVSFVEGQQVHKGDLLAVIDPRPFQAAVDEAAAKTAQDQANLANAQYLLEKDTRLAGQQIVTQEELEQQRAQVNALSAQLQQDQSAKENADISLSYTQIRSPIDGRTGIRQIDPGNQVSPSGATPIVTITQMDPISVISTLREGDLEKVKSALAAGPVEVRALSMDMTTELGSGDVLLIDNEINQDTGTIKIKSTFANPQAKLWPGQSISLRILQKLLPDALTVPSAALQRGPDGYFLYVVDSDGRAQVKNVTVGPIEEHFAMIASGLAATDDVVVTGQYRLSPGAAVDATPVAAPTAAKE